MNLPFELYVSLRYLVARRKQASMASTSLISVLGVTVGVTALIVALALMTGLQQELRDRIADAQAHVYVWNAAGGFEDHREAARTLTALPGVEAAAPAIPGKALARTRAGDVFINVKGIDPALEAAVTGLAAAVERGSLPDLTAYDGPALGGVVIGEGLARELGAFVGDEITLITPSGTLSPMGVLPRPRRDGLVGEVSQRRVTPQPQQGQNRHETAHGEGHVPSVEQQRRQRAKRHHTIHDERKRPRAEEPPDGLCRLEA